MLEAELEFSGAVFVACRFVDTGLTFEPFLRHPLKAIASLEEGPALQRWARSRTVSATKLAKMVGGGPPAVLASEDCRKAGIAEHERFDQDARRFMAAR